MAFWDYIFQQGLDADAASGVVTLAEGGSAKVRLNPQDMAVSVAEQEERSFILVHQGDDAVQLSFDVGPYARLRVVEVLLGRGAVDVVVRQQ